MRVGNYHLAARMRVRNWIYFNIVPQAIYNLIRLLRATIDIRFEGFYDEACKLWKSGKSMIFVFWHGRLVMMPFSSRSPGLTVMVSRSRDGEMLTRVLNRFKMSTVRGSSSRGAREAMEQAKIEIRCGKDLAIAPDGPKGPRKMAKKGALLLARETGAPIVPVSFAASRTIRFNSWDKFCVPLPFTRGVFYYDRPFYVDSNTSEDQIEVQRRQLEKTLNSIDEYCNKAVRN